MRLLFVAVTFMSLVLGPNAPAAAQSRREPDLNVDALLQSRRCPSRPHHVGCRILTEFAATREPLRLPTGKSDWFGRIISIDGELDRPLQYAAQVANTGGIAHVNMSAPVAESPEETRAMQELLLTVQSGSRPVGNHPALTLVTSRKQPLERLTPTRGRSYVRVRDPRRMYVRKAGDRLLIVGHGGEAFSLQEQGQRSNTWCAELWRVQ
jgi:hypothetical protein